MHDNNEKLMGTIVETLGTILVSSLPPELSEISWGASEIKITQSIIIIMPM
jgi:hypothetical protein